MENLIRDPTQKPISNIKPCKTNKDLNIVIIDDDPDVCELLKAFYEDDYSVIIYKDAESALKNLKNNHLDIGLILCDLMLPKLSGIEFLEKTIEIDLRAPVILITAHASKETAFDAIQKGAFDYITKPLNFNELEVVTNRALKFFQLEKEFFTLKKQAQTDNSLENIVGKSKCMTKLFELIKRAANTPANVLITGESGTGKEMVAKALHNLGPRRKKPFVAINCSAIPNELLESELFGHKKGSFTGAIEDRKGLFEEAKGGTLFLDEIGDLPLNLQSKLLRAIQEKKIKPVGQNKDIDVDVRIISATHQDLRKKANESLFRDDLYFRLCVVPIKVPALRDRREDIPLLANTFFEKFKSYNHNITGFSRDAMDKLIRLSWPGNVRELENTVERALALSSGPQIQASDISTEINSQSDEFFSSLFKKLPSLKQLEKTYIQYVLQSSNGKKEEASKILGINRKTLYRKEKDYS